MKQVAERLKTYRSLGARGERRAARFLRRQGFEILHRNYRIRDDEADLIALDPDGATVVIIEVKTRRHALPPPEASIGPVKRRHMIRFATRLQQRSAFRGRGLRFDAVSIVWPKGKRPLIRHFPAAFDASG